MSACVGCGRNDQPAPYGEGYCERCWFTDEQRELGRLRAGISTVRGMCTDGEPLEVIDAKLGELLGSPASDETEATS